MMVASSPGTSFPRRREPRFVEPPMLHAMLATYAHLGSRLRGNDGVVSENDGATGGSAA